MGTVRACASEIEGDNVTKSCTALYALTMSVAFILVPRAPESSRHVLESCEKY